MRAFQCIFRAFQGILGGFNVFSKVSWDLQERLKKLHRHSEELCGFHGVLIATSGVFGGFESVLRGFRDFLRSISAAFL